jgi:hypothetical protein
MNAYTPFRTLTRTILALSLVLLLTGSALTTASAQPMAPEDPAASFETMARTLANPSARAGLTAQQWQTYAGQLTDALASGHGGLQQGALRMIIQYGDELPLARPAAFDAVRIYRNHPNDDMRRMAVVALGQMHDAWAIDFLKRSARFEEMPRVRATIHAVLATHDTSDLGPARISN